MKEERSCSRAITIGDSTRTGAGLVASLCRLASGSPVPVSKAPGSINNFPFPGFLRVPSFFFTVTTGRKLKTKNKALDNGGQLVGDFLFMLGMPLESYPQDS